MMRQADFSIEVSKLKHFGGSLHSAQSFLDCPEQIHTVRVREPIFAVMFVGHTVVLQKVFQI